MQDMKNNSFDPKLCTDYVEKQFTQSALPSLSQYIKIKNQSRAFDSEWDKNGLLLSAAQHIKKWVEAFNIKGLTCTIIQQQGLSPLIFTQIKGDTQDTVLFYGHYDKQPPFLNWDADLGPYQPVLKDNKLYGRGGADDGYATYGTMIAIKAVQEQGLPIPRCVMITEGDEESGSAHMNVYLPLLKDKIGIPSLIFCLDSGTLDYERLWITNSMRGLVSGRLRVDILTEGVHSGDASGIVPSPFRVVREILQRVQSAKYGDLNQCFQVDIPSNRYQQMYKLVQQQKNESVKEFPFVEGVKKVSENSLTSVITRGWKAQLAVIGISGLPQASKAGNVMLPFTEVKLSIRLPPTKDPKEAEKQFVKILTQYPPYNAKITVSDIVSATGFNAPQYSQKLQNSLRTASLTYYGKQNLSLCEGMSIPLLGLMKNLFPKAQFIVTGVLGPQSNAHGPNQFLHIPYVKKLIMCIAHVIATTQ